MKVSSKKRKNKDEKQLVPVETRLKEKKQVKTHWTQNWLSFGQGLYYTAQGVFLLIFISVLVVAFANGLIDLQTVLNILANYPTV